MNLFNVEEDMNYLIQNIGKSILVNGISVNAIVSSGKNKEIEEKSFTTKEVLKRGDLIVSNDHNYLVINEINGQRQNTCYKAYAHSCNYNMKIIIAEVLYEIAIILQTKTLSINSSQYLSVADGKIMITMQNNAQSSKIKTDDRVILMKQAWKVDGIDTSLEGLTTLFLSSSAIDTVNDDLINDIADKNKLATYSISICNGATTQIDITQQLQLNVVVTKNVVGVSTVVTSPNIVYSSSDASIATISSMGLVTFQKIGSVNLVATLASDSTVISSVLVTVVSVPKDNFVLTITGNATVKLGQTITYTASLTNNGVVVSSSLFDFVLNQGATPSNAFTYVVNADGCSVSIKTLKYPYTLGLTAYLRSDHSISNIVSVLLKGSI